MLKPRSVMFCAPRSNTTSPPTSLACAISASKSRWRALPGRERLRRRSSAPRLVSGDDDVVAGTAIQDVEAGTADEHVIAVATQQDVVAVAADEDVVPGSSVERELGDPALAPRKPRSRRRPPGAVTITRSFAASAPVTLIGAASPDHEDAGRVADDERRHRRRLRAPRGHGIRRTVTRCTAEGPREVHVHRR